MCIRDRRVDAIFAGNDTIALGVLDYASSNGYNIPEDLGVIGYDDIFYLLRNRLSIYKCCEDKSCT